MIKHELEIVPIFANFLPTSKARRGSTRFGPQSHGYLVFARFCKPSRRVARFHKSVFFASLHLCGAIISRTRNSKRETLYGKPLEGFGSLQLSDYRSSGRPTPSFPMVAMHAYHLSLRAMHANTRQCTPEVPCHLPSAICPVFRLSLSTPLR